MLMKIIASALYAVILAVAAIAHADEPKGFRDVPWGASEDTLRLRIPTQSCDVIDPTVDFGTRRCRAAGNVTFGKVTPNAVFFYFRNDMLVSHVGRILVVAMVLVVGALSPVGAAAQQLRAVPFVFIGKADDCGAGTFGSHIVTSAWLGGMGLPDDGGDTAFNGVPDTAKDPHYGLLLSKNRPSPDCSSAGARILGARGMSLDATFTLGFDFRNGGHCGPRAAGLNVGVPPPAGPGNPHL